MSSPQEAPLPEPVGVDRARSTPLKGSLETAGSQQLIVKEKTPTSLVLKLRLPPQRLRDLVNPGEISASMSIQSSPPPSSPVASTVAAMDTGKASTGIPSSTVPTSTTNSSSSKKKAPSKVKKTKIVIGGDGKPVEILASSLASRLGPKANAGAINENLRNLDRSGKPCRRWQKKHIVIRSLYGAKWRTLSYVGETTTT